MAHGYDTMMTPAIEELLDRTESKFVLVTLAAMRSREITNYLGQLGGGIGASVPPQVISKIEAVEIDPDAEAAEAVDSPEMPAQQGDSSEGAHLQDVSDPERGLAAAESSEPAGSTGA